MASLLVGCSFVLDFPGEGHVVTGAGGAGGAGAAGTGGSGGAGGSGACGPYGAPLTVDKTTWRGTMLAGAMGDYEVMTTGLAHRDGLLRAYGKTTNGLEGLFTGSGSGENEMFLVTVPDAGGPMLAAGITNCNYSRSGHAGRMTLLSTGAAVVSGLLGTDSMLPGPGAWSFTNGDASACGAATNVPLELEFVFGGSPFFALIDTASITPNVPPSPAAGTGLDVDARNGKIAAIGVAHGNVWEATTPDANGRFFLQRSTETTGDTTYVLEEHFGTELYYEASFSSAGIAVDDAGNAWFGGGSCDDIVTCSGQGAFFGVWEQASPTPELIVQRPPAPSTITTVNVHDNIVLIGGRYDGALSMLGEELPQSSSVDAFVMAVDPGTRDVLWTYPDGVAEPGYEKQYFNTVVGLAALGTKDCGAVYVLGCTVEGSGTAANCDVPGPKKRAFLAKLDMATGAEIAIENATLANPGFELFVPTAIAADDERVWMAASVGGTATFAGAQIPGATPMESVVLQISR